MKRETRSTGGRPEREDGGVKHSYTSSLRLQFLEFVKKFVFTVGIYMIPVAIYLVWLTELSLKTILAFCLVSGGAFLIFWSFFWCHIRIEVSADGVRFYRWGYRYETFSLTDHFSPVVITKKINGIFCGTDRDFWLPGRKYFQKKIHCRCITGKDYLRLVKDINTLCRGGKLHAKAETGQWEKEGDYRIPPGTLQEDCMNFNARLPNPHISCSWSKEFRTLMRVLAGILTVLMLSGMLDSLMDPAERSRTLIGLFKCLFLISMLYFFLDCFRFIGDSLMLTRGVILSNSGIWLGEKFYPAETVREIVMTLPMDPSVRNGYSFQRCLTLYTKEEKAEYLFDVSYPSRHRPLSEDDERLLFLYQNWCGMHHVGFREESN